MLDRCQCRSPASSSPALRRVFSLERLNFVQSPEQGSPLYLAGGTDSRSLSVTPATDTANSESTVVVASMRQWVC